MNTSIKERPSGTTGGKKNPERRVYLMMYSRAYKGTITSPRPSQNSLGKLICWTRTPDRSAVEDRRMINLLTLPALRSRKVGTTTPTD